MIIMYIFFSIIGAFFTYVGIDTIVYASGNICHVILGAIYAIGGVILIGYIGADACDYYGWEW